MNRAIEAVPDTPTDDDEPRDWGTIAFRGFVVLLLAVLAFGFYTVNRGQTAEEQRRALLALIEAECGPGGSYVGQPICVATAPERAAPTQDAATAAGIDASQVIELVRAELAANPPADGRTPTTEDLMLVVRQVLDDNPDTFRGPGPTDDQVSAAAAAVLTADPEAFRGPAGEPGEPGQAGADGQSPACLAEPAQCRGADGTAGAPPVSITQRYADGSSSVCTRDEGSPPDAPTYTCPPPTGADPAPAPPGPAPTPPPEPDPPS